MSGGTRELSSQQSTKGGRPKSRRRPSKCLPVQRNKGRGYQQPSQNLRAVTLTAPELTRCGVITLAQPQPPRFRSHPGCLCRHASTARLKATARAGSSFLSAHHEGQSDSAVNNPHREKILGSFFGGTCLPHRLGSKRAVSKTDREKIFGSLEDDFVFLVLSSSQKTESDSVVSKTQRDLIRSFEGHVFLISSRKTEGDSAVSKPH
ncbi:hypothetical protein BaRGS_00000276 [Batillaria attramentaria]|uniref:Uncharacterized protein n=1 Tax=Batillaria attramentaria TaxID=370345 RepID=A0ABD0MBY0_9CAEN